MAVKREDDVLEDDVLDGAPGLAAHQQQPFGHGNLDDGSRRRFARARHVGQDARRTIQVPAAGTAKHLLDVLDPEARAAIGRVGGGAVARCREADDPVRRVKRADAHARGVPLLQVEELQVCAI